MRNLKKFLALVLAMMMAFSLMVTANAKDITAVFSDADSVTKEFKEAVDVTNGMGILQGYEDGTYKPKNNIRRSEVTALVYRLFTGDVKDEQNELQKHYVRFKDVSSDDWFAGYVGACQNAELIKGDGAGNFMPNRNVTGYEALAMILRAMGYDQNHEFEGTGWQVRVGAIATQRHILDNINNTNYSATLSMPATRELVAEMIFQAAQQETVVYTPGLGYQTANLSTGVNKDSLGKTYFGLTEFSGIVVGNQDTGEASTRINSVNTTTSGTGNNGGTTAPSYVQYFHQTQNWNENLSTPGMAKTTNSITIDAVTGLDWFGHSVSGWYCNASGVRGATAGKTFALYDDVVKTAVVTAGDARLSNTSWSAVGHAQLGEAAQAAGFNVDLKNSKAVFNRSFGISSASSGANTTLDAGETDYVVGGGAATSGNNLGAGRLSTVGDDDAKETARSNAGDPYGLFLLISNNSANTVDMVISLNVQASKITQVNNYATYPTVTVPTLTTNKSTRGIIWNADADTGDRIAQDALTASSTKELGKGVVGVSIEGTKTGDVNKGVGKTGYVAPVSYTQPVASPLATANENNLFRLSTPSKTVEGQVTQYKYDPTSHTGFITINGQRVERSLLADTITEDSGLTAYAGDYKQYRAYLDSDGKYIWVEPIETRKFVYGTYLDYTTPYGSSAYEYTIIGVDEDGNQTKEVVKTFNGTPISGSNYKTLGTYGGFQQIPYRDNGTNVAGVTPGIYVGYTTDGNGNILNTQSSLNDLGWERGFETANTGAFAADANTEISATDAKLGMKLTNKGTSSTDKNWYITENTKVIAVSGAGTDNQKVKVYNGITELLDGGTKVIIESNVQVSSDTDRQAGILNAGTKYRIQTYYTESRFTYASVQDNNYQIDTLILPASALRWEGKTTLHYMGDASRTAEIQVGTQWFTQFTMYENGEEKSVWVDGRSDGLDGEGGSADTLTTGSAAQDKFVEITPDILGRTLPDGTVVYNAAVKADPTVSSTDTGAQRPVAATPYFTGADYWAATYAAQTATVYDYGHMGTDGASAANVAARSANNGLNGVSYRVDGAKVVNLNAKRSGADLVWPTVTDLASLNDAASTAEVYSTKGLPVVSCQVDPANPLQITVIYVQWDQP